MQHLIQKYLLDITRPDNSEIAYLNNVGDVLRANYRAQYSFQFTTMRNLAVSALCARASAIVPSNCLDVLPDTHVSGMVDLTHNSHLEHVYCNYTTELK